jgi:hypothetical protein
VRIQFDEDCVDLKEKLNTNFQVSKEELEQNLAKKPSKPSKKPKNQPEEPP